MNWLPELIDKISLWDAAQDEKVALVSLATALAQAAEGIELPIPSPVLTRSFTMPSLMWWHETAGPMAKDRRYYDIRFCIEDPVALSWTVVVRAYGEKQEFTFRNPNLRERLRTFFTHLPQ